MKEINSNNILVCRTSHDWKVNYPFYWSELIIDEAKSKGFNVIDLKNEDVTREKLNKLLDEEKPFFIFGNGHGESWAFKGYRDKYVIEACKNDNLLKNKIVYLLSCFTSRILSESAIKKGCFCFISYTGRFSFITQGPTPKNILDDVFAKAFMDISNQVPLTIISGGTPEEAWKNSQKKCDEWIDWWNKSKLSIAPQIIGALLLNKKRQCLK